MLIKEIKEGDTYSYLGNVYDVKEETFVINNIYDLDKQIKVDLIAEDGMLVCTNFWKSDYGKNANIYIDKTDNTYKLAEIEIGTKVKFVGFRYDYRGVTQFNPVGGYQVLEDQTIKFKANMNVERLKNIITQLLSYITNEPLKQTCLRIYKDYHDMFVSKPAARSHHHNYTGGLLQHTVEVMLCAYNMSQPFKVNTDYIIVASFLHDIMKVKEYADDGTWQDYGNKIGHIVGSAELFKETAKMYGVNEEDITAIEHCMLAHHGRLEWGSPVTPNTPEAAIVHEADMMSSRINPLMLNDNKPRDYYLK